MGSSRSQKSRKANSSWPHATQFSSLIVPSRQQKFDGTIPMTTRGGRRINSESRPKGGPLRCKKQDGTTGKVDVLNEQELSRSTPIGGPRTISQAMPRSDAGAVRLAII